MNYLQNKYNIVTASWKPRCTTVWNIKVKNIAITLPLRDNKAVNYTIIFLNT